VQQSGLTQDAGEVTHDKISQTHLIQRVHPKCYFWVHLIPHTVARNDDFEAGLAREKITFSPAFSYIYPRRFALLGSYWCYRIPSGRIAIVHHPSTIPAILVCQVQEFFCCGARSLPLPDHKPNHCLLLLQISFPLQEAAGTPSGFMLLKPSRAAMSSTALLDWPIMVNWICRARTHPGPKFPVSCQLPDKSLFDRWVSPKGLKMPLPLNDRKMANRDTAKCGTADLRSSSLKYNFQR
jgi:hypothetical protein